MFDAIVILGSQPNPANWTFPDHVYASLERAVQEYNRGVAPHIVLSGDHAIRFDFLDITQPFRECDALAEILLARGIPPEALMREGESRDTISNFYFVKRRITEPLRLKRLRIITADFRVHRIEYLATQILGRDYEVNVEAVPSDPAEHYGDERAIIEQNRRFLGKMRPGDDRKLDGRFFSDPYYDEVRMRILNHSPEDRLFT